MGELFPKKGREEREKIIILKYKYDNRITTVRFGKECLDNGDYSGALHRFNEYMNVVAEVKSCTDHYQLKVTHFNPHKDITEMLLISHVFFEMARIYDAVPKFHEDSKKCLEQFVRFSANQPYQVVNSEIIRKHMKKSLFKNPEAFRVAHQQIYVQSKKCYVVTYCYGEDHALTQEYRLLKDWLLESGWGQQLVRHYYVASSEIVTRWENNRLMRAIGFYLVRPMLLLFSKTVLRLILK